MSKQDRTTLKSFFRDGAMPTAENFRDLIDSSVNQVDDGFDKSQADGFKLNSAGASLRLMSFYQGLGTAEPSWTVEHGQRPGALHLRPGAGPKGLSLSGGTDPAGGLAGLTLTREGKAGIFEDDPQWRLDVNGAARMTGRVGMVFEDFPEVAADGRWHDITPPLTGCQMFEVVAGTGGEPGRGRYSLLHAIAMNAFHPRNIILNWLFGRRRIKCQTAVYGSYADRLRLRWVSASEPHHFKMQLRSNAKFGSGKTIRFHLTRLWFDPLMTGSRGGPGRDETLT